MFGLSFLTTLNIYKDYFKGRKRLHTVAQEHNSTSVKKSVTGNLVCPSSSLCDEQKNFAANVLLKLVIKSRTGIRTIG